MRGTENAGVEISARSSIGKSKGWEMQEWKNQHGRPKCRGGK